MKEAGHADWSTRNQLQITGQDSLLTKGLIRASLFAQYRMSILLCSFNPNFPKIYRPVSFLNQVTLRQPSAYRE